MEKSDLILIKYGYFDVISLDLTLSLLAHNLFVLVLKFRQISMCASVQLSILLNS